LINKLQRWSVNITKKSFLKNCKLLEDWKLLWWFLKIAYYYLTNVFFWRDCVEDACKILLDGHVQVGFDYSKGVSHPFFYELRGYRYVLFCWCHDPPRTPQTLSAGQGPNRCPNQISGPRTRTPDRTNGLVPSGFRRFRGVRTYRKPRKPVNRTGHSNCGNCFGTFFWNLRQCQTKFARWKTRITGRWVLSVCSSSHPWTTQPLRCSRPSRAPSVTIIKEPLLDEYQNSLCRERERETTTQRARPVGKTNVL